MVEQMPAGELRSTSEGDDSIATGSSDTYASSRHGSYRNDVKRRNAALVDQRLASLESSFRVKLAERQGRLGENRARGNERAAKLFEAQIRKLESDYEERRRQIEEQKTVSVRWAIEGDG